ncbi:Mitochondrial beta-keto-acyl synthase, partial [Cladochytrium tenue]
MRALAGRPPWRRVVVTGLGLVSPLGTGVNAAWGALVAGRCGVVGLPRRRPPTSSDAGDDDDPSGLSDEAFAALPSRVAACVPRGSDRDAGEFDPAHWVPKSDTSKTAPFMHYAYAAAQQALEDADWFPQSEAMRERTGVCIGSGLGYADDVMEHAVAMAEKGIAAAYRRVSPLVVPRLLLNMAAGNVSIRHGLRGPNHSVSTACATGAHALGDAMRFIQFGDADVMVAGGSEAAVIPLIVAGFARAKSLSTAFNDRPEEASRPFDSDRDGFVMGEGAGVVVLVLLAAGR